MDYKKAEQHYENLWKRVGNWENESPIFKTREPSVELSDFIKFLKKNGLSKGKVLDLGCGGGRHVILFAKNSYESYGIDFSKAAIRLAKIDAKKNNVNVYLDVGNILSLKYPKHHFDVIHDKGCLHHTHKKYWKKYLQNIRHILKKDGYYFLYCFNSHTEQLTGKSPSKKKNWIIRNHHYTHFFTKKEISNLFSKYFDIIQIKEIHPQNKPRAFYICYLQKK